jgi:exosortase
MSSVANSAASAVDSRSGPRIPWVSLAWFGGLLVLCYLPVLARLVRQWNDDEDMGHGFFVPVIAAYIAYQKWGEFAASESRPNYWGVALLALGAVQLYIGTLGAELFLARTALIESIVGAVLLVGGTRALRVFAFPLFLLCFMVPIPAVIYNQITFPLQLFASDVAARLLELGGVPVLRDGNILDLPSQRLNVVEACSGIRSLLTLGFLSLVYGYFFDKRPSVRAILFLSTVPIAIAANALRVTLTGVLSEIDPELAHGFMHTASGWVIFMIALAILVAWHQILNRLYGVFNRNAEA